MIYFPDSCKLFHLGQKKITENSEHQAKNIELISALDRTQGLRIIVLMLLTIFVLRKKGSKTKERMKEEEIEKGDCGPPTRKVFFWFCRT